MYADAILMPVGNSLFDRESAADCIAEVRTLPRVVSGRCRLAAIGMRLDLRTEAAGKVQAWAAEQRVSLVAMLRESNAYVRCVEQGLTLFDMPSADVEEDLAQWKPVLGWIRPLLAPGSANDAVVHRGSAHIAPPRPLAAVPLRPRIETPPHPRARVLPPRVEATGVAAVTRAAAAGTSMSPVGRLFDALPIPRFLQRTP
jgi:chromosome partitioning protein